MTRDEKAISKEEAAFKAAGWRDTPQTPRPTVPYLFPPPRSEWLPCWQKVFR